jgi:hypothetical protein
MYAFYDYQHSFSIRNLSISWLCKFKSSGLSIAEKATAMTVKVASQKMPSASVGGSGTIWASTRALDFFGSGSSMSDDEVTLWEPPHKCPSNFPLPMGVPKPLCQKVILSDCSVCFIVLKTVMVNLFILIQLQQLQLGPLMLLRIWRRGERMFVPPSLPRCESHQLKLRPSSLAKPACWTLR